MNELKLIVALIISSLVIFSCSESSEENDQLKALESKLEQQEEELNQQKEEMLKRELEAKEQEIERLKEENSQEQAPNPPAKNNSFVGPAYGYGVYPEGSSRPLSSDELSRMTKRQLKIMRNEIFARHGYIFKTQDMIDYFSAQPWYEPTYNDVSSMLSKIEKSNITLIKSFE